MYNTITYYDSQSRLRTIEDKRIFGGVTYQMSINPEENLMVGGAYSAKIEFTTEDGDVAVVGKEITYSVKQINEASFKTVGKFIISDVTRNTDKYTITAYDYMSKFDKVYDVAALWINPTDEIQISTIYAEVCTACGVSKINIPTAWLAQRGSTSGYCKVQKCINGSNITGRTVLGWIAGYVGGFAVITMDGSTPKVEIKRYSTSAASITDYKYFDKDTQLPTVDSVWVGQSASDVGTLVKVGSTSNYTLRITGNPFFSIMSGETQSSITPQMNLIKTYISGITYTPTTMELFKDYNIEAGHIITVKDNLSTVVMNKSWNSTGVSLSSTGTSLREVKQVDQEIVNLNGQYHSVVNNVNTLNSTIGNWTGTSTIAQTVDGINTKVATKTAITESSTAPSNPSIGDYWHYSGTTTTTYTNGRYYR